MSLSFVSKTVQTTTESGEFEEKPIEPKDGASSGDVGWSNAKPLFEQLRANLEQEEAEREEQQRAIMRGSVELNEEDCAHLDALDRQKQEKEAEKQRATLEALAAFRTAQADKLETMNSNKDENPDQEFGESDQPVEPLVVIRRKRRRDEAGDKKAHQNGRGENSKMRTESTPKHEKATAGNPEVSSVEQDAQQEALGGLLIGYGSSDDE
ncbi:hypothetical protein ACA910_005056 [Epithemia clementina (nom. ined.)]